MRLQGKRAFVTAAGQGIGHAIAAKYLDEGADVIATDIDADLLARSDFPKTRALDVTNRDDLKNAVTEANADVLVNCAGFVHVGDILEAQDGEFEFAFQLNVRSQFHAMQAALPGMIARGGGSIINISSVVSSIVGAPNRFIYGASKAAVIGMTKSVAIDYVSQGIRCNCICPGTVESPSLQARLHAMGNYDEALRAFEQRQPMGRIGTPDEIALLAVYLGSDESAFTTGQAHIIDGGWAMG